MQFSPSHSEGTPENITQVFLNIWLIEETHVIASNYNGPKAVIRIRWFLNEANALTLAVL